jgi:hypothetical protein
MQFTGRKGHFVYWFGLVDTSFLSRWTMPTTPQTVPKSDEKNSSLCASNGKALHQTRRQGDSLVMLSAAKHLDAQQNSCSKEQDHSG